MSVQRALHAVSAAFFQALPRHGIPGAVCLIYPSRISVVGGSRQHLAGTTRGLQGEREGIPIRAQGAIVVPEPAPWSVGALTYADADRLGAAAAADLVRAIQIDARQVAALVLCGDELEVEAVRLDESSDAVHVTAGIWCWAWSSRCG